MPRDASSALGHRAFRGRVTVLPSRADGFLTTPESARLLGVKPWLIRKWRSRGWLMPQGLDERGNPLHTPEALWAADELVRGHGVETSGIDPRRLRNRSREPETTTRADAGIAA